MNEINVAAPRSGRRRRRYLFPAFLIIASTIFLGLAVLAHGTPHFPIDLAITRALQRIDQPAFAGLMRGLSWLGFLPQATYLGTGGMLALFLAGLRREAVALAFAGLSGVVVAWIKVIVFRPRPSPDLVRVLNQLSDPSFPSGHVMTFTAYCGFLIYVANTRLKSVPVRAAITIPLALIILLMGPSRVYLGDHWFSDAIGAYALGSLWLALTIVLYLRK